MRRTLPTPADLNEIPQLAVLNILDDTLELSTQVLIATHPEYSQDERPEHSEDVAYSTALVFQIHALEATLRCYRESLQRSRERPSDMDWPEEGDARVA